MTVWVANDMGLPIGATFSVAFAVSANGLVIACNTDFAGDANSIAARWTSGGGFENLGVQAGGTGSSVNGVSADGTIVVGSGDSANTWVPTGPAPFGTTEIFRWTSGTGMVGLGFLGTGQASQTGGISADGTTIVGASSKLAGPLIGPGSQPLFPFVWTAGGGMVELSSNDFGSSFGGYANAVSADGSVVVGYVFDGSANQIPVIWVSGGAPFAIPFAGGLVSGFANAVSADGSAVTGLMATAPNILGHAFLANGSGVSLIGEPFLQTNSAGVGISGDGLTIVGQGSGSPGTAGAAWIWTLAGGFEDLPHFSGDFSANTLAISSDGTRPVGDSTAPAHAVYWGPNAPVVSATMAELWFSNTAAFVDLTQAANRRKFISATGGTQNLGVTGELPFGVAPVVFLTTNDLPATFPVNNGRGGTFAQIGGALVNGATDPPGTSSSVTTGTTRGPGQGVLGDYRNGNLYGFNPATYLDNGTPRKWVRRWRALPADTIAATRYSYLAVLMQTGAGVPSAPVYALNSAGGTTFVGGSSFAVGDIIALVANDGVTLMRTVLSITSVAAGVVTGWVLASVGNYTTRPTGFIQSSSSGVGTGFTLTITNANVAYTQVGSPNPQVMLRWSDDGGHVWSNYRMLPVGRSGETAFTVKANRLGSTSRFSGSNRIFELSSTDPFKIALLDAEIEAS